jgi:hypothetical protein
MIGRGESKALLDLRKVRGDPPLSYVRIYDLARLFQRAGFGKHHRLAVVISPERFDKADFFATFASGRPWNCFAFDDFADAFDWLSEEAELPVP